MTKEHILKEIQRTAEQNGGAPLGRMRFLTETGIREADWLGKFWARWGDAVREAGYVPNKFQQRFGDEFLFEKYIGLTRALGRLPAAGEVLLRSRTDRSFPHPRAFYRFGLKTQFVQKLAEHCRARKGFQDIVRLCEEHAVRARLTQRRLPRENEPDAIYLMKSGKFYKIGRSKAPGRRAYDLGIQLPERLAVVHVIRTDDPAGVEAYWHKRFAAKRRNGEWFDLSLSDVAAFKRRKFM